jgi:hypothetical protein
VPVLLSVAAWLVYAPLRSTPSRLPAPDPRRCRDLTRLGVIAGLPALAGVSGLTCRVAVLLSGASIDGSLLYGDLPALDGAETTDIAEALVSEFGRRPQHPKSPASRIGVGRADCNLRVEFECGASGVVAS